MTFAIVSTLDLTMRISFGSPIKEMGTTYKVPFECSVDWRSLHQDQQMAICEHAKGLVAKLGEKINDDTAARLRMDHVEVVL